MGRVSIYLGKSEMANFSNNIMRIRLNNEVNCEFINALMNLDNYNKYIRRVSVGGTDKRALSKAIIGELPIILPPLTMQCDYVNFVHQTNKVKLTIQQSLDTMEMLKKALMQEYFG